MKNIFYIIVAIIILSCNDQTVEQKPEVKKENDTTIITKVEAEPVKIEFNWFSCKETIRFLNCNNIVEVEKEQLVPSEKGFLYGYCLHNGNQPKNLINPDFKSSDKLIEVITFMEGDKIKNYDNKEEQILFLKSRTKNESLNNLNIVGLTKEIISNKFLMDKEDFEEFSLFTAQNTLLLCKFNSKSELIWFKFYPKYKKGDKILFEW